MRAQALSGGKSILSEHPVRQGAGSLFASKGIEQHASMYDHPLFVALIKEFGLLSVFYDRGALGLESRKTTHMLCSADLYPAAQ